MHVNCQLSSIVLRTHKGTLKTLRNDNMIGLWKIEVEGLDEAWGQATSYFKRFFWSFEYNKIPSGSGSHFKIPTSLIHDFKICLYQ